MLTSTDSPKTDRFVRDSEATYTLAYTKSSAKSQTETKKNNDVKVDKPSLAKL